MKCRRKIFVALIALSSLSACRTPEAAYYTNYKRDYIYSVTYYGYRPYDWGDGYYNTFGWGTSDWNRPHPVYQSWVGPQARDSR